MALHRFETRRVLEAVEQALGESRYDAACIRYDRVTLQHDEDELVVRSRESGEDLDRIDLSGPIGPFTIARQVYTLNAVEVRR